MNNVPGMAQELRWLILDLNSFFASCEQQDDPALRGLPVAVVPLLTDSTSAIAASYEAKAFGVKTGTKIYEARQRCPGLRVVQAQHKRYLHYHERIKTAIETCIPIDKTLSIDEFACRLDKVQREPEAAAALAHRIKACIQGEVGACLTSSIGIASNKLLAKLASNMQKPNGLTILRPEDLPQAIAHLPTQALPGIGHNMGARLAKAGIHDIAALWAAESGQMRRLWGGITGARFHALLHGADLTEATHARRSLSHQHVLAPRERSLGAATPIMRQLVVRAAERLRREGFYCRRLAVGIKWLHHEGYWGQELTCRETQDTAVLLQALTQLWGRVPGLQPLRIGVVLADLVPVAAHQGDLFETLPPPARRIGKIPLALSHAIDAVNTAYGRGTLHYGLEAENLRKMTSKIAFQRVPGIEEL